MAVSFNIPASPKINIYQNENFLGCDFTSDASTVDDTKSPDCVNMTRLVPGKVRKRMGYHSLVDYGVPVYGVHHFSTTDAWLVHAGTKIYEISAEMAKIWLEPYRNAEVYKMRGTVQLSDRIAMITDDPEATLIYEGMAEQRSWSAELGLKLVILDGTNLYTYDGTTFQPMIESTTIKPKITLFSFDEYSDRYTIPTSDYYYFGWRPGDRPSLEISWESSGSSVARMVRRDERVWLRQDIELRVSDERIKDVTFPDRFRFPIELYKYGEEYTEKTYHTYIPTLTISKDPEGGGTDYEALNLLNPAFKECFYVAETKEEEGYDPTKIKTFQLTFGGLDDTTVKAWVMDANGDMIEKTEGTDFTVNRERGTVTFAVAPGASPVKGEDNVHIQAYRTVEGYEERVTNCRFGILFGVNGANDRMFISGNNGKGLDEDGNPYSYINYDWYSGQYDPTYFPDTGYSKLGADSSAIMGYTIIGGYLATHKDTNEMYQPVIIREGDLVNDQPTFLIINALQGAGAISPWCFSYLEEEPLFFSKLGIYAITAQDITGEKYAQNRSYYLDGKLLEEDNLSEAFAYTYRDFYILCVNGKCYVLDGLQPIRTDKSQPYATRQYVGFYWDNIPASCMFEMKGRLCFGSADGHVYAFYKDKDDPESYSDMGEPIMCKWETADISEQLFYKYKKYRYLAIKSTPTLVSSVEIWARRNGIWEMIKEDRQTLRYFDFTHIDFTKFSFSTDDTAKVVPAKVRLRKLDHAQFKFVNAKLNEPFALINFAVEYTQGGNHK